MIKNLDKAIQGAVTLLATNVTSRANDKPIQRADIDKLDTETLMVSGEMLTALTLGSIVCINLGAMPDNSTALSLAEDMAINLMSTLLASESVVAGKRKAAADKLS